LKSGVSLRGQDKNNAILSSNFNTVDGNTGSYIIGAAPGVNNLTISNLKFNMYGGQSLRYPIWLGADPYTGDVYQIEVKDCIVTGFEKMAISVRNGHHIYIHDNTIKDASALGGGGEGYGIMIGYPNSQNNWVKSNYIGPNIRHAVLIQYSAHHNLVEYNTADSTTEDSYDLHGEDEYSNELRYNIAFGSEASGFGIGNTGSTHYNSGPKNWIHHNEVYNSAQGINIINESHQQYIEDNNFHNNSDLGIKVYSGGAKDLVFKRNKVQYNQAGARFEDDCSGLVFDANIVTNNTGYSIKALSGTTGYVITNNDFRFNGSPAEITSSDGVYSGNLE
jgi:hypothetical protein